MKSEGLFDLQVNGYAGVDFNDSSITPEQLDHALEAMLADGVTGCLPTLITAYPNELEQRFQALDAAVANSRLGAAMVPGYHLEGPFLNSAEGYRGCHPHDAMTDPDVALVARLGERLHKPILLLTLAPERTGSREAITAFRSMGIVVAMAHSQADYVEVEMAANAGLTLSTHLGNGLPQQLHKVDNTLLAQLAEPRLMACLIADGLHLSPNALNAMLRLKTYNRCILVTDAVLAAGAAPGNYSFAGMPVVLDTQGTVRQPGASSLAGSALRLDQAVRNVCEWSAAPPAVAVVMASLNPRRAIAPALQFHSIVLRVGELAWDSAMQPHVQSL